MSARVRRSMGLALGLAWLAPVAGTAAEPAAPSAEARTIALGRTYFKEFCVRCHGAGGKGDGPDAKTFRRPLPDLTTIRVRSGDRFDAERLVEVIDGRKRSDAHEKGGMPVWGEALAVNEPTAHGGRDAKSSPDRESVTRGRIRAIVRYLESIQSKGMAAPSER